MFDLAAVQFGLTCWDYVYVVSYRWMIHRVFIVQPIKTESHLMHVHMEQWAPTWRLYTFRFPTFALEPIANVWIKVIVQSAYRIKFIHNRDATLAQHQTSNTDWISTWGHWLFHIRTILSKKPDPGIPDTVITTPEKPNRAPYAVQFVIRLTGANALILRVVGTWIYEIISRT